MSLPVNRDTVESIMKDMLNRIRALEAKRQSGGGGSGFGESVEVDQTGQVFVGGQFLQEFDTVYDPHGIFDGTDTFTIPAGLAGIWQFSMVWRIDAE